MSDTVRPVQTLKTHPWTKIIWTGGRFLEKLVSESGSKIDYKFRGAFLTSPTGADFGLKGKVVPKGWILSPMGVKFSPGVKFSVRPSILLNSRECSPLGVNKGVNIHPRELISSLGPVLINIHSTHSASLYLAKNTVYGLNDPCRKKTFQKYV
jgi:hypothetical protein